MPANILPLAKRPLNVLTVANINPRKGYLEYLAAIKLVHNAIPDAQFIFVGRDDMDGQIQKAISAAGMSGFINFEGFQSDVSHYFRNARVCVLPSLWGEGCPTSLLESMAWGVPVVANRIDGVPELISDGIDGFLLNPQHIEKMADQNYRIAYQLPNCNFVWNCRAREGFKRLYNRSLFNTA